ncbi:MAG: putative ABC transporter permease [Clostridiales bacterium]|nr:putative ABC transporter permease [Clostridiales bacterium]
MFFLFSFAGWLWEVGFHLVLDGTFVNRGVLSGPWLPIYGAGGVLILVVLRHFFDRPGLLFFMIMLLCGVVEYVTGWWLETFWHTRWWDYREYIFEIQGRVCLSGLLVFGIGGLAFVYGIAPGMDRLIRKMEKHKREILCIVLLLVFVLDFLYSLKNPNMGVGITTPVQRI